MEKGENNGASSDDPEETGEEGQARRFLPEQRRAVVWFGDTSLRRCRCLAEAKQPYPRQHVRRVSF